MVRHLIEFEPVPHSHDVDKELRAVDRRGRLHLDEKAGNAHRHLLVDRFHTGHERCQAAAVGVPNTAGGIAGNLHNVTQGVR